MPVDPSGGCWRNRKRRAREVWKQERNKRLRDEVTILLVPTRLFPVFPANNRISGARIWAWMLNMPHSPPKEGAKALRENASGAKPITAVCDQDRACGRGFSCDRHFGLCVPLRGEGQYCRRDAQCIRGLSCMFGKCHRSIPNGQEGARCKVDRDCGESMCCARHHGEQVCKRRLLRGESCYVPDGGLAFSINQICPCDEGLLCRGNSEKHRRERDFVYQPELPNWTCQIPRH
ncbi:dickkopf-related protein 3-like isoform X1 [Cheilinus undulatus]|uniref:dickkopf-related protein 3-like isoform X1 n=1 Tax=Cheilinus undulatus TaxID=241271 RepID=UPI001BD4D256|nr:dickkopf-related protein 3-like isoform X1 [Cheilinus undulatus]